MIHNADIHKHYAERAQRKVNRFLWFVFFVIVMATICICYLLYELQQKRREQTNFNNMTTKIIIAQLIEDTPEFLPGMKQQIIRKQMNVVISTHHRFLVGNKFDYGFMSQALDDGYVITILPLT